MRKPGFQVLNESFRPPVPKKWQTTVSYEEAHEPKSHQFFHLLQLQASSNYFSFFWCHFITTVTPFIFLFNAKGVWLLLYYFNILSVHNIASKKTLASLQSWCNQQLSLSSSQISVGQRGKEADKAAASLIFDIHPIEHSTTQHYPSPSLGRPILLLIDPLENIVFLSEPLYSKHCPSLSFLPWYSYLIRLKVLNWSWQVTTW